jgi:hypothetical protein
VVLLGAAGLGIGLGAHALGVFDFGGGGPWGRDWEERKTREMMDKEGEDLCRYIAF